MVDTIPVNDAITDPCSSPVQPLLRGRSGWWPPGTFRVGVDDGLPAFQSAQLDKGGVRVLPIRLDEFAKTRALGLILKCLFKEAAHDVHAILERGGLVQVCRFRGRKLFPEDADGGGRIVIVKTRPLVMARRSPELPWGRVGERLPCRERCPDHAILKRNVDRAHRRVPCSRLRRAWHPTSPKHRSGRRAGPRSPKARRRSQCRCTDRA